MAPCGILSFQRSLFSKGDFTSTLADLRLRLSYPGIEGLVLVEGESDEIVMQQHFSSRVFLLTPFCKGSAIKIIEQIGSSFKNVIAILDLDYSPKHSDERVFYYDGCNLEMMLIKNDDLFTNFDVTGTLPKSHLLSIRDNCLYKIKPFSCLRYLIAQGGASNRFSQIKAKDIYPQLKNCLSLDRNAFLAQLYSGITCLTTINKVDVSSFLAYFASNINQSLLIDDFALTNGHDFNELFHHLINPTITCSLKLSNKNTIYKLYARAFGHTLFIRTDLYRNIRKYERKHKVHFI